MKRRGGRSEAEAEPAGGRLLPRTKPPVPRAITGIQLTHGRFPRRMATSGGKNVEHAPRPRQTAAAGGARMHRRGDPADGRSSHNSDAGHPQSPLKLDGGERAGSGSEIG
jgi:hypothetical protein